jgi:MFS family permease
LGGIALAPGYLPRHAVVYLYAAFTTIGLFAFVSYMQPWLLTVNLGLPAHLQGRTVSALNFANELVALALVAPFGALGDKIGRRSVYAFGFLWLAAGFLLYPLARTLPQLTGCALFFSVGVAADRHDVRDGAGRYSRRNITREAGRARGVFPGPGRCRRWCWCSGRCRNA